MIDEKMLAEIEKACADARFGYGSVTIHTYYRHVSALLDERKLLMAQVAAEEEAHRCTADALARAHSARAGE